MKKLSTAYIVIALLAGCRHPATETTAPEAVINQGIREISPWLLSLARDDRDSQLIDRLKPIGFTLDPRKAAFIYGNLFHTARMWSDFPNVRLFVTDDCYLCIPAAQECRETLGAVLSVPTCVAIRALDGMVYDKSVSQWRRMGYLNDRRTRVQERARGHRVAEVIVLVGVPYRARGYSSDLVLSWEILLTPRGYMLETQFVDTDFLVKKIDLSSESIIEYWCEDGHLAMRFVKGSYQEEMSTPAIPEQMTSPVTVTEEAGSLIKE